MIEYPKDGSIEDVRNWIKTVNVTFSARLMLWAFYYIGTAMAYIHIGLRRAKCFFGFHLPGEYLGKIKVNSIDRDRHQIDYQNVKQCPFCKKDLGY